MTFLQPDCQLRTFSKMDEYPRVVFFLRGSWKLLRTKLVCEPLSAVEQTVWCAFIRDAAESIANYWMVIGPSIVFRISE